jgi:hypothetical protein
VTVVEMQQPGSTTPPALPNGSYRLQPVSLAPSIQAQASEVQGQVWSNDNDLFAAVVSGDFTSGDIKVTGSSLLFGVNYQVTVYNIDGFQPGTGNIAAGTALQAMITVAPNTHLPLSLISSTASTCTATSNLAATTTAVVTFTFNQSIEDGTTTPGGGKEALDNGLSAQTFDGYAPHASTSSAVQERGTSLVISGSTLTISFDPMVGITSLVTGDTLEFMSYSGLSTVFLQPIGHPENRVALSSLIGTTIVNCVVTTP